MQEIVIDISATGEIQVEAKQIDGPECVKLTAALEEALGTVARRDFKPEYRRVVPAALRTRGAS